MKKKMGLAIGAVVCVILLGFGIYKTDASQQNPRLSVDDIRQMVEAQYPGEITEIELDTTMNKSVYEVEVISQGREYEIKLDGQTGEILNLKERATKAKKESVVLNDDDSQVKETTPSNDQDVNPEKNTDQSQQQDKNSKNNGTQSQSDSNQQAETPAKKQPKKPTVIDVNQAIAIAKSQFNGTVIEAGLDEDDGRLIYEIELENGQEEAEIEVDAYTGEILLIEIDRDDD